MYSFTHAGIHPSLFIEHLLILDAWDKTKISAQRESHRINNTLHFKKDEIVKLF